MNTLYKVATLVFKGSASDIFQLILNFHFQDRSPTHPKTIRAFSIFSSKTLRLPTSKFSSAVAWAAMGEFADGHTSSTKIESSIESGKFLKLSSQALDIRVRLNSTFGVEYFE